MIFNTNINSYFSTGLLGINHPISGVYCLLVALELSLKRSLTTWGGHDIPRLLENLANKPHLAEKKGVINSHASHLRTALNAINVRNKNGIDVGCPADSYPNIRYALMQQDGCPAPKNVTTQLAALYTRVTLILRFIKDNQTILGI